MSERRSPRPARPKVSLRFRQLLAAALDGDENAPGDLWREFGVRFEGEAS